MLSPQETPKNEDIGLKLDLVVRLLAAIYTKGSNKTDAITKLGDLRLSPREISEIVGVSGHHVSQVLYAAKKRKKKVEKSGPEEAAA